jgi:hypothetical protein
MPCRVSFQLEVVSPIEDNRVKFQIIISESHVTAAVKKFNFSKKTITDNDSMHEVCEWID